MSDSTPTGANPIPPAEVDIDDALMRRLLASQHPDLVGREIRAVTHGWDNVIYRIGDDLAARMPRREIAAPSIEREQRWLPELAARLPLPIPTPVRVGHAEFGYPWSWSVTPWFDGDVAADAELGDPTREAKRLGAFMAALHEPAPADAPTNPFRDGFIGDRADRFDEAFPRAVVALDVVVPDGADRMRQRWKELIATEPFAGPPVWVAGDVHTGNIIVADGEIRAVIDFGDLCARDPAVDLAVAWMLFDPADRSAFRAAASRGAVEVDDAMWRRAEAWACYFAVMYLANSADDERLARMGRSLALTLLS